VSLLLTGCLVASEPYYVALLLSQYHVVLTWIFLDVSAYKLVLKPPFPCKRLQKGLQKNVAGNSELENDCAYCARVRSWEGYMIAG
jgi:hypothetical protein